jgi:hypothetical protein
MSTPASIVGYEVAHSICDELDTMPQALAEAAWTKIIARNRQKCGVANTVAVATTPEGYGFVWHRWVKTGGPGYKLFHASTMDNSANLPDGYIDNLRATYSERELAAYLDGQFVNLKAGSVYPGFDRKENATSEVIKPGEPLHIGMDFNVSHMAAVVHVIRDGMPYALDEFTGVFDTPAMIALIKREYPSRQITVYPDASGGNRKSYNASASDLTLLRQAPFLVCSNAANPAVKDRVLAMNKVLGSRDYKVNIDKCPVYAECLEKQAYDKHGDPDKTGGLDHSVDAGGYFVAYRYPIVRASASFSALRI